MSFCLHHLKSCRTTPHLRMNPLACSILNDFLTASCNSHQYLCYSIDSLTWKIHIWKSDVHSCRKDVAVMAIVEKLCSNNKGHYYTILRVLMCNVYVLLAHYHNYISLQKVNHSQLQCQYQYQYHNILRLFIWPKVFCKLYSKVRSFQQYFHYTPLIAECICSFFLVLCMLCQCCFMFRKQRNDWTLIFRSMCGVSNNHGCLWTRGGRLVHVRTTNMYFVSEINWNLVMSFSILQDHPILLRCFLVL